jgi:uncharacterized membrane-anchored protein YhcB (DUF1043 family)
MGEKRQRTRIRSKIDDLPPDVKVIVDLMLADTRNTYQMIADYINTTVEEQYISKSAVGAYALRKNNAAQRLMEAQEQTKTLIEVVKNNPEADYTEGGLQILAGELTKKIAWAGEEFDEMSIDKAGRLMVALSRTKTYKDKIRADLASKIKVAVDEFKKQVYTEFEKYPDLLERIIAIANQMADSLEADE